MADTPCRLVLSTKACQYCVKESARVRHDDRVIGLQVTTTNKKSLNHDSRLVILPLVPTARHQSAASVAWP